MDEIERRISNIEIALFGKTGNHWHETAVTSSGERIGKIGAMTHLIDKEGFPISRGYHSITRDFGFRYIGTIGASEEEINIDIGQIESRDNRE